MARDNFKRSLSEDIVYSLSTPAPGDLLPATPSSSASPSKKPKIEIKQSPNTKKKLAQLATYRQTPWPTFLRPTPEECQTVHDLLSTVHGTPKRPARLVDLPGQRAGCGESPNVLDALVRTILSQNTTSKNSTSAKNAMDAKYGRANYRLVLQEGQSVLAETIKCGGLGGIKAKCIMRILQTLDEKEDGKGTLDLQYLHHMADLEVMEELVSFPGVGPKTASCVLLFSLGRNSFAVDTHVFRISKSLGWLPASAPIPVTRDTAFQHLDVLVPDDLKYGLHSLLVSHGRGCEKCSANGVQSMDVVESCPIDGLVKRVKREGGAKKVKAKGGKSKKGKGKKKEESDEEEEAEVDAEQVGGEDVKQSPLSSDGSFSTPTKVKKEDALLQLPPTPISTSRRATRSQVVKEELSPAKLGWELVIETERKPKKKAKTTLIHGIEVPANE